MAEHEVEALVGERQRGGVAGGGLDLEAELCALCSSVASIPGLMSVQVAARTTPVCSRFSEK